MRVAFLAFNLALLCAAPAMAQSIGAPAPATPTDVDRFNGPDLGEPFPGIRFTSERSPMERLRMLCGSSALRDRRTCNQAWREIRAAYTQLQAARQAGS